MDESKLDGIRDCRARGEILKLVRMRHRAQNSRMDHVELWHMLRGLGLDIGEDDALTYLQDLEILGFVQFVTDKARRNNRVSITQIQLCAAGLAVLEGRRSDDSILL